MEAKGVMLQPVSDVQSRLAEALAGRYTLERELGRGGMSIVYLAYDERLGRKVALKILRPELAATLGPDRFLREIKVVAGLSHPHILPLHDSGEAAGMLYYVMPYVEGESLRHRLTRERRLPLEDALEITREVADALEYAHQHDIVHRDIKPENILLQAGQAVVSDFGIARAISEARGRVTGTGIAVGTPEYMSPEQASGGTVDGRTDVYSLGCVLYEMLAGRSPGATSVGAGQAPTISAVQPAIPIEVEAAIEEAMAQRPEERFPRAADFARALREPGMATVSGARRRRRLERWWTRGGLVAAGVAAAVVVWRVMVAAGTATSNDRAPDPTHIAVLYLDDLSPDSSLRHIASGLTEDLIDRLSAVSALSVTSPNGVRPYRGRAVPPDSVARALGAGTIVSGSIARAGNLLRVRVRLVDGRSGQVLHSTPIDRPFGDLFALQDSVAVDIAAFLRQRIGEAVVLRERRAGTRSVDAWDLVRRADALRDDARGLLRAGDDEGGTRGLLRADSMYRQAEAFDRRWSVPVVSRGRIAQAFGEQIAEARPVTDARAAAAAPVPRAPHFADEWLRVALTEAGGALALRPDDPEAVELRGSVRYRRWLQGYVTEPESLTAAEQDLQTAVATAPGLARAWYRLSLLLRFTGRFAEAEQAAQRALDADAFLLEARPVYATLYFTALNLGRYDEARARCAAGRARFPDDLEFAHCELRIIGWSGRGRAAIGRAHRLTDSLEAANSDSRSGSFPADRRLLLAAIYARSGRPDSARALVVEARAASPSDTGAAWFLSAEAYIHVLLGERAPALDLVTRVLTASPQLRGYVGRTPWFASLHDDPRFVALAGPL